MQLPIVPLHGAELGVGEEDDAVTAGLRLLSLEKRQLIDAADRPVLRDEVGPRGGARGVAKKMTVCRRDFACFPSRNGNWLAPSIARSFGTMSAPAAAASVG